MQKPNIKKLKILILEIKFIKKGQACQSTSQRATASVQIIFLLSFKREKLIILLKPLSTVRGVTHSLFWINVFILFVFD